MAVAAKLNEVQATVHFWFTTAPFFKQQIRTPNTATFWQQFWRGVPVKGGWVVVDSGFMVD